VQQTANQGRLAIINRTSGCEAKQGAVLGKRAGRVDE
jgi:hypothetical protein